jgi:hypothetical protein
LRLDRVAVLCPCCCQEVAEGGGAHSPLLKHRVSALAGIALGALVIVGAVAVVAAKKRRAVVSVFWRKMDEVA